MGIATERGGSPPFLGAIPRHGDNQMERKLTAQALAAMSLDREEAPADHPLYPRAAWEEWKANMDNLRWYSQTSKVMTDYAAWLSDVHYTDLPKARDHFTTRQMAAIVEMVTGVLRDEKGYDQISGHWSFGMDESGYKLYVSASDSWQDSLPYAYQSHNEDFNCHFTETKEIWDALRKIPRRERRELECLLRQTNNFGEMAKQLRGRAARAFAEELIELSSRHQNLLEDLRR